MSNEHLDMSGNLADAPFTCEECGKDFKEWKACGTERDDSLLFCCADCVRDWEDRRDDQGDLWNQYQLHDRT